MSNAPKFSPAQIAAKLHSLLPRALRANLNDCEIELRNGRVRVAVASGGINVRVGSEWWRVLPAGLTMREIAAHISWL